MIPQKRLVGMILEKVTPVWILPGPIQEQMDQATEMSAKPTEALFKGLVCIRE
jgi:hypothetical protein